MPFEIKEFWQRRPFAYHLTSRANASLLEPGAQLMPARFVLEQGGMQDQVRKRRKEELSVRIGTRHIVLKDQKPLIVKNAELEDGWDGEDFIAHLNEHVFFWPGTEMGPVKHGQRLIGAYDRKDSLILRIPTVDLLEANAELVPLFCAYNSGAPRKSAGKASPRGPGLFSEASAFPRSAAQVVELVFQGTVRLPLSVSEWAPGRG
jgi:hypothetical protein